MNTQQKEQMLVRGGEELTPPNINSPTAVHANRMQFPLQNPFGDTEFTFQSPSPGMMGFNGYSSPFGGSGGHAVEPEVTYEVIENQREGGNGRKRGVNYQLGSIWDVGGNGGGKRSRHM